MNKEDAIQDAHLYFLELGVVPTAHEFNRRVNEIAWNNRRRGNRVRVNGEGGPWHKGKIGEQQFLKLVKLETLWIESDVEDKINEEQQRAFVLKNLTDENLNIILSLIETENVPKTAKILDLTPQRINQKLREFEIKLNNKLKNSVK